MFTRNFPLSLNARGAEIKELHTTLRKLGFTLRRVAEGHCWPSAPSEPCVPVSQDTAQAFLTPGEGRGFTTSNRWLWTCLWQFGCKRARFSALSLPPLTRQVIW